MHLRPTAEADLDTLFEFQLDETANDMAAFIPENWADRNAYLSRWKQHLASGAVNIQTIVFDGQIAGSVLTYEMLGEWQISYWLGKAFWGQGLATQATQAFLNRFPHRPVYGRVAFDNAASIKVLEKCGFARIGTDTYFSHARGQDVEEIIYKLGQ